MSEEKAPEQQQPEFNIEKTYVKNISLELPHAPEIYLVQETPEIEMKIGVAHKTLEEGFYDCSVTATVTATLEDKRVVFLAEAEQSGIFRLKNIPEGDIELILNVTCPNILFPYLREVITDLTVRAGFPPVYMAPLNFEAMYRQQQEQAAEQ